MKTAEDIIYDAWGVKATDSVFRMQPDSLIRIIEQVQNDAWDTALELAAEFAVDRDSRGVIIHDGIDSESIRLLKREKK